jgi:hypothetical protein
MTLTYNFLVLYGSLMRIDKEVEIVIMAEKQVNIVTDQQVNVNLNSMNDKHDDMMLSFGGSEGSLSDAHDYITARETLMKLKKKMESDEDYVTAKANAAALRPHVKKYLLSSGQKSVMSDKSGSRVYILNRFTLGKAYLVESLNSAVKQCVDTKMIETKYDHKEVADSLLDHIWSNRPCVNDVSFKYLDIKKKEIDKDSESDPTTEGEKTKKKKKKRKKRKRKSCESSSSSNSSDGSPSAYCKSVSMMPNPKKKQKKMSSATSSENQAMNVFMDK